MQDNTVTQQKMIKVSKFAKESGSYLTDSIAAFQVPTESPPDKKRIWFLSGDMTQYGHKDVRMPDFGHEQVRISLEKPENLQKGPSLGQDESRQTIANNLSTEHIQLKLDDVIMTHGANIGLLHCLMGIVNAGENILIPEPSYPFYQKLAIGLNIDARPYKLIPEKSWEIDLEDLEQLIDEKTKFIWIVNPSNPCGSVFSRQHVQDILDLAKKHQKLVVSDEVYYNEAFEQYEFTSFSHLTIEQPVIILSGCEKNLCIPGWSISWLVFYDKHNVLEKVRKSIKNYSRVINSPAEILSGAFPSILEKLTLNFTNKLMPIFWDSYQHLYQKIGQMPGLSPIKAQGTFYLSVLIDIQQFKQFKNDIEFLQQLLNEENIFILSLSCFGGGVNGFRIMMAAPLEFYDGFIQRLSNFCIKYHI